MEIEYWDPNISKEEKCQLKNLVKQESIELTKKKFQLEEQINNIMNDKSILFNIIIIEDDQQMINALIDNKDKFADKDLFLRIYSSKDPNQIENNINNEFVLMKEKINAIELEINNLDHNN